MDKRTALKIAVEAFADDDAELAKSLGKFKAQVAGLLNPVDAAALDSILGKAQERAAETRQLANAVIAPGFKVASSQVRFTSKATAKSGR